MSVLSLDSAVVGSIKVPQSVANATAVALTIANFLEIDVARVTVTEQGDNATAAASGTGAATRRALHGTRAAAAVGVSSEPRRQQQAPRRALLQQAAADAPAAPPPAAPPTVPGASNESAALLFYNASGFGAGAVGHAAASAAAAKLRPALSLLEQGVLINSTANATSAATLGVLVSSGYCRPPDSDAAAGHRLCSFFMTNPA